MLNGVFDKDGPSTSLRGYGSVCSVHDVVENGEIVLRFQEGLAEADYVDVLLEEEMSKFLFFV